MKILDLDKQTKAELIELVQGHLATIERLTTELGKARAELFEEQRRYMELEKELRRAQAERNNYFDSHKTLLETVKNLSEHLG